MEKSLNYSDVYLVPKYSELTTRSNADTSVNFLGRKFKLPIIPANMASVISEDNAKWLSQNDYFYIMHRFGDNRKFLQRARAEAWKTVSISVGVKDEDKEFIVDIADTKCRVDFVTIDIAHGFSVLMKEMIDHIKKWLPDTKIIAGNICTPEAVSYLGGWGADAAKVGIAGGGACSTKNMTGFHVPMFSCVKNCATALVPNSEWNGVYMGPYKIPIIADGGIRENGDITKALVAGGSMVMAGSIFAACTDAPGESIEKWSRSAYHPCEADDPFVDIVLADGSHLAQDFKKTVYKKYFGSASATQKGASGQTVKHIEGFELEIPCNGLTYSEKYQEITDSLRSSISYAGGSNLEIFKSTKYITVK